MTSATIRTCFFDMGNVLVHFDHSLAVNALATLCGRPPAAMRRFLFDEGREFAYEKGLMTTDEIMEALQAWCGKPVPREELIRASCDIFSAAPGMLEVVRDVKDAGCRLVLLSNTNAAHFQWISRRYPVLRFFDAFTLSYEVQAMKPEPAIFQHAIAQAEAEPAACFYTDDVPEYVQAAKTFGIQAHLFRSASDTRQTLRDLGVLA